MTCLGGLPGLGDWVPSQSGSDFAMYTFQGEVTRLSKVMLRTTRTTFKS